MATQRRRFGPAHPLAHDDYRDLLQRDDLYMSLINAGIAPERAYEMVEKKMPYAPVPQVRNEPIAPPRTGSSRVVGLFALLFGIPLWLEAARFTRDGWILFIDWVCARFAIPWHVPPLHWGVALSLIAILGFGYSYVEMAKQPVRLPRNWRKDWLDFKAWKFERRWEAWIVWIVLIASDIGTTYAGAKNPDPSGLAIMRDIVAAGGLLAAYAIILTFIPDRLVRYGWRAMTGGRRWQICGSMTG